MVVDARTGPPMRGAHRTAPGRAGVALRVPSAVVVGIALLGAPRASTASGVERPLVYAVVVGHNDGWGVLPQLRYAEAMARFGSDKSSTIRRSSRKPAA